MLRLVQNLFAKAAHPIGVDLGTDCLRMAQVQLHEGEFRLIAAASADVPSHLRSNAAARLTWFADSARDLLSQGGFRGRQVVLGLPASMLIMQHLRMPKVDEETLVRTLPFEARGKLPVEPTACLLRHVVAGEVFSEQDPKIEVIVMAAAREFVNQLLDAAASAKLDVIGMNVEPRALIDCFANVYRRRSDRENTCCFVDIGSSATRAIIAQGEQILFARSIPIGGDIFTRAAADAMNLPFEDVKLMRVQAAQRHPAGLDDRRDARNLNDTEAAPADVPAEDGMALLNAAVARAQAPADDSASTPHGRMEQACREPLARLVDELNLCRRYHESNFPNRPVQRLIFVGGEARQRWQCQMIARQMQLPAQIGDPMVRMSRTTSVGVESGLDRRQPQPGWAVATGLSMGQERAAGTVDAGGGKQSAAQGSMNRGLDNAAQQRGAA